MFNSRDMSARLLNELKSLSTCLKKRYMRQYPNKKVRCKFFEKLIFEKQK